MPPGGIEFCRGTTRTGSGCSPNETDGHTPIGRTESIYRRPSTRRPSGSERSHVPAGSAPVERPRGRRDRWAVGPKRGSSAGKLAHFRPSLVLPLSCRLKSTGLATLKEDVIARHYRGGSRDQGCADPRIALNRSCKRASGLPWPSSHRFAVDSSTPRSAARRLRENPKARRARDRRADQDSAGSIGA